MEKETLIDIFSLIGTRLPLPEYLRKICTGVVDHSINRYNIDKTLKEYEIHHSIAKVDFLNIIFEYIQIALEDGVLTTTEKENIHFLKLLFHIQPGDFYLHNQLQMEGAIQFQLTKIYLDDFVNEAEALLKVDLQEIFDLSFDQMNEYAKKAAIGSIQKGFDPKQLDVFMTQKEYFKLKYG